MALPAALLFGAGGMLGGFALPNLLGPVGREVGQIASSTWPNQILDPGVLSWYQVRPGGMAPWMREQWERAGFDAKARVAVETAGRTWPSVAEAAEWYRLGIIPPTRFEDTPEITVELGAGVKRQIPLSFDHLAMWAGIPPDLRRQYVGALARPLPLDVALRLHRWTGLYPEPVPVGRFGLPSGPIDPTDGPFASAFQSAKRAVGLENWRDDAIFEAFRIRPNIHDIIRFAVREVYDKVGAERLGLFGELPPAYIRDARKMGVSDDDALKFWGAHWYLPSPTQVYEMFHRQLISRQELRDFLRIADYSPPWRENLEAISYRPIGRVDIRRLYRTEVIPRIDPNNLTPQTPLIKSYMDLGYNFESSRAMALWTDIEYQSPAVEAAIKQVTTAFRRGYISEDEFERDIKKIGLPPDNERFVVTAAKADAKREALDREVRRARGLLKNGRIGVDQFRARLRELDLGDSSIERFIRDWEAEESEISKGLTDAEIIRAWREGIISTEKDAVSRLVANGRTEEAAKTLVKMAKRVAEVGEKSPPLADLRRWLQAGMISVEQFTGNLREDGYPQWAIENWITEAGLSSTRA